MGKAFFKHGKSVVAVIGAALILLCLLAACSGVTHTLTLHLFDDKIQTVSLDKDGRELPTPVREGYDFSGWYFDEAYSQKVVSGEITEDTDIYAKWTRLSVTVKFVTETGGVRASAVADKSVFYGDRLEPPAAPTANGYEFLGWYEDAALKTALKADKAFKADATLYAKWQKRSYTLVFDANYTENGAEVTKTQSVIGGTVPEYVTFDRTGYMLAGWYLDENCVISYDFSYALSPATPDSPVTLYAKWKPLNYNLEYKFGETVLKARSVPYNTMPPAYDPLNEAVFEGAYFFEGWFTDAALTLPYAEAPITADTTLYGKFIKGVKVEFYVDDNLILRRLYRYGQTIENYAPDGYDLSDVWKIRDATDPAVATAFDFAYVLSDADTLIKLYNTGTAKSFTLTAAVNDSALGTAQITGSAVKVYGSTARATAEILAQPFGWRCVFSGWFDESGALLSESLIYDFSMPARNLTLTAVFEKIADLDITLASENTDQGSVSGGGKFAPDSTVTITATPAAGYRFVGWYDAEGTLVSADQNYTFVLRADVSLTAKFVTTAANLYFDSDGGTSFDPLAGTYGDVVDLSDYKPRKQGYSFVGWNVNGSVTASVTMELDKTATAIWKYGSEGFVFGTVNGRITAVSYDGDDIYVKIPKTDASERAVTALGEFLFHKQGTAGRYADVMSVEIPSGIQYIATHAFSSRDTEYLVTPSGQQGPLIQKGMPNIDYLYIPASVTQMGDYAFEGCNSLSVLQFGADIANFKLSVLHYTAYQSIGVFAPNGGYIYAAVINNVAKFNGALDGVTNPRQQTVTNAYGAHYTENLKNRVFAIDERAAYPGDVLNSEQLLDIIRQGYKPATFGTISAAVETKQIWDKAREILQKICSDDMSEYQKVLAIHDWVIINNTYDHVVVNAEYSDQSLHPDIGLYRSFYLEGSILDGITVCDGYSKAVELLCSIEGIDVIRIAGIGYSGGSGGGHAWNKVKIDGKWYFLDATWDDADQASGQTIMYNYFLIKDPTDHEPFSGKTPVCDADYPIRP